MAEERVKEQSGRDKCRFLNAKTLLKQGKTRRKADEAKRLISSKLVASEANFSLRKLPLKIQTTFEIDLAKMILQKSTSNF